MRVKVLLFAGLREKWGSGEADLEIPLGTTPQELSGRLFADGAVSADFWRKVRFAVNLDYVPGNTVLHEGDEVALIPPVAGG